VTPGAAVAWLAKQESFAQMAMPVSIFFVFPIVLMSMIETNSVFGMVSFPVLRTLFTSTSGWLRFYATSAVLIAAVGSIDWLAFAVSPYVGDIVVSVTQAALWLIYFRLMGRLAWYCADRSTRANLDAALDAVLDDEDSDEVAVDEDDLV
jgi:hypothetical protein